jgi:hypothetical protein
MKLRFIARFYGRFGGAEVVRYLYALHSTHALKKAQGIARKNGWTLASVGQG